MIEGLATRPDEPAIGVRHGRSLDRLCCCQIAIAARFLRSIRPRDGEVEIMLHEIARRLEQVVDTGEACRSPMAGPGTRLD